VHRPAELNDQGSLPLWRIVLEFLDALPDLPLLGCHSGAKPGRKDVKEHDAFDFVGMPSGKDPRNRAAERVRNEDVRARDVGRLQEGDEIRAISPAMRLTSA
jgi:hypothetical protein